MKYEEQIFLKRVKSTILRGGGDIMSYPITIVI